MSAAKKPKTDDEGRVFNNKWCSKYLVVPHSQGDVCLVSYNTTEVMKKYNGKRHYTTEHSSQIDDILGQTRVDKIEHQKNVLRKHQECSYQLQERFRNGYKTES